MPSYPIIDQFAARLDEAGLLLGRISQATRIEEFERMLGRRLPKSFRHLVTNYAFRPFEWGPVSFFGNGDSLGTWITDGNGVASLEVPPRYRGKKSAFEAVFDGSTDTYWVGASDSTTN